MTMTQVVAQQEADTDSKFEVHKVNDSVYILSNRADFENSPLWLNCGVVIGEKGILLISSLMKASSEGLVNEIKKLSNKPITHVLNIGADPFHHDANQYFADQGAMIISQEQLKSPNVLTQLIFKDKMSLNMGTEIITAYHTPAHDYAQTIIQLEKSNVIFMGDAFRNDWLMFTGVSGIAGQVAGLNFALNLSDEKTKIVPGNRSRNAFSNKRQVLEAKQIMLDFSNQVGQLYKNGLSVAEMQEDKELNEIASQLEMYENFHVESMPYHIQDIVTLEYAKAHKK